MNLKALFSALFIIITGCVHAQDDLTEYIPKNQDSLKLYLKQINVEHIQRIDGEFSGKIKKLYKDRDEKVIKAIEDSTYVFNADLKKNLDLVLHHIYQTNPEINSSDYYFFVNNSTIPNASCYGNGMFEINLGLFTRLDSEDELAFVICHEIAHKLLDHSLKGIHNAMAAVNSKATKDKVKKLKKIKYGQTRAALSVIDELNIDLLDYSKEVEAEADSLGYLLYSKTKYSKNQALSSLEKLKRVDEMVFHHDVKLDSVFNFDSYPFQMYWLKETTSLFDIDKKINEFELASDTLKTHPEIEFRVHKLRNEFAIEKESSNIKLPETNFKDIKQFAHIQSIDYTYDKNYLDFAMYLLIEKIENNHIQKEYYSSKMAMVLKRLYEAKQTHEIGKYVPLNNNFSDEKQLNTIRLFLHNLELNEIKKIGLEFCKTNQVYAMQNKEFEEIYTFFKNINNN